MESFERATGAVPENSLEQEKSLEKFEHPRTRVILEFMRHSKKETDPAKTDEEILLTEEGRALAVERGKELQPQPEVSLAYGSPKKRTQETTGLVMLGNKVGSDANLNAIEEIIQEQLKYGKKIVEDKRLSFDLSGPSGAEALAAFKAGKYLSYLLEESDRHAIETRDIVSTTYLRQAGNVAELVKKYTQVGENFHRLVENTGKYKQFGNQLERYMGTHLGVVECFVAKALEKTNKSAERDMFIKSIGTGTGFGETRGMHVEITNTDNGQKIMITYPVKDEDGAEKQQSVEVSAKVLDEIVKDRIAFDEQCAAKQ